MTDPIKPDQDRQPAFSARLIKPGCSHCGHGERYTIVGPGIVPPADPDEYLGWTREMVKDEIDRLNRIFEAGRRSV